MISRIKQLLVVRQDGGMRLDIQALRALAVLSVVIYHLWPNKLPGGFMGVDIFFVISGYLMTTTLMKSIGELNKHNKRQGEKSTLKRSIKLLANFYARRIKRLAPAATVTLLAVLLAVSILGRFSIQENTATQVIQSTVFMQNWYLADQKVDYLGSEQADTAVQHFWSLSVEEQFYMIWPVLLLVSTLVGVVLLNRKKKDSTIARILVDGGGGRLVPIVIAIFTVTFFIIGYYLTLTNPESAYFVTTARIWELALGGIIMFLPKIRHKDLRLLLPYAGLIMCAYALDKFNGEGFPGWHALIPTIGTALVIWANGDSKYSISNFSRFRPIQFIGNISYSMYLYYVPILVLSPLFLSQLDFSTKTSKLALLFATIIAGWISYKLIETPTRKLKIQNKYIYLGGVVCMVVTIGLSILIKENAIYTQKNGIAMLISEITDSRNLCLGARSIQNQDKCGNPFGYYDKTNAQFSNTFMNTVDDQNMIERCDNSVDVYKTSCELGDLDSSSSILISGDSHSEQYYGAFDLIGKNYGYKIIAHNSVSCAGGWYRLDNIELLPETQKISNGYSIENCNKKYEYMRDELYDRSDVIIVATNASYYRDIPLIIPSIKKEIDYLLNNKKRVILMQDNPIIKISECRRENCIVKKDSRLQVMDYLYETLKSSGYGDKVGYLKVEELFCDDSYCYSQIGSLPVYYNDGHINSLYSLSIADHLGDALFKLLDS